MVLQPAGKYCNSLGNSTPHLSLQQCKIFTSLSLDLKVGNYKFYHSKTSFQTSGFKHFVGGFHTKSRLLSLQLVKHDSKKLLVAKRKCQNLILVIIYNIRRWVVQVPPVIKELSYFIETMVKASHTHIYNPAESTWFLEFFHYLHFEINKPFRNFVSYTLLGGGHCLETKVFNL